MPDVENLLKLVTAGSGGEATPAAARSGHRTLDPELAKGSGLRRPAGPAAAAAHHEPRGMWLKFRKQHAPLLHAPHCTAADEAIRWVHDGLRT